MSKASHVYIGDCQTVGNYANRPRRNFGKWSGMESHKRSIVKAVTWRVVAVLITFLVAYFFTRELVLATSIGLADAAIKIFVYYSHERVWDRIDFGRRKKAEEDYII